MSYPIILGRDFLQRVELELKKTNRKHARANEISFDNPNPDNLTTGKSCTHKETIQLTGNGTSGTDNNNIFDIDLTDDILVTDVILDINRNLPPKILYEVERIIRKIKCRGDECFNAEREKTDFKMQIRITKDQPLYSTARRLPYSHKEELRIMLDDLSKRGVIRESDSPYASPIVLVKKKNGEMRLCVDYRELNKITLRDNFPLPLIEDHLDALRGKRYFSVLDLKNGFHHVPIEEESIKYTSFITPLGQFEYLRMPFGLKNAPAVFEKFMKRTFKDLITAGKVLTYIDDLLIATSSLEEHIEVLKEVVDVINRNSLRVRFDKCHFLHEEIVYLGYKIDIEGIRPNDENLRGIKDFPLPTNVRHVHSFLGLCSYFRKFIKNFAEIARPLYELLKKDSVFKFGQEEIECFELLKSKLLEPPVLAIYHPHKETQLHCDASGVGFGSVLVQKQDDGKFHPIFYFSKRANESERKFHSFELETLSIIYALRRFRIYLLGMEFKIFTDCEAFTRTLSKKIINPRIARWALELQEYNYQIEHRKGTHMAHADALSRVIQVLHVQDDNFEFVLGASQRQDPEIVKISIDLEKAESSEFEMIDGLVYRKFQNKTLFYVPIQMESQVIQVHHDMIGHLGSEKTFEYLRSTYWFPSMRSKVNNYVKSCLKCMYFSPHSGKVEGTLHSVPKGNLPFEVLHVDHLGPLSSNAVKKKHIFSVIDGFTKFVRLYAVSSTSTKEAISCLKSYFETYSRPNKIISDRGRCFTSEEFAAFSAENNIKHVLIATQSPQSNGQVERINRVIIPILAKSCGSDTTSDWHKYLIKVEFGLNNTISKSTGYSPSMLLFGINQKGEHCDKVKEYLLEQLDTAKDRNLAQIREIASENIAKSQEYNKLYYDKHHKSPTIYKKGDYVLIKNISNDPGINKKLFAKYKGPYEIVDVLPNDRYAIKDLEGMQISRIPYKGVCAPANMKLFMNRF